MVVDCPNGGARTVPMDKRKEARGAAVKVGIKPEAKEEGRKAAPTGNVGMAPAEADSGGVVLLACI